MSDQDQAQPEQPTDATPDSTEQPAQAETDWKAEARKWESRAKENREKAAEFDKLQEANKSEAEKAADRLKQAETAATAAQAKALRLEVALDLGLPKSWATRLQGSTEEELRADAEAILADLKQPTPPVAQPPRERLVPGNAATPPEASPDPKKIAASVLERRR